MCVLFPFLNTECGFSLLGLCVIGVSQIEFAKLMFHLQKYLKEIKKNLPRALFSVFPLFLFDVKLETPVMPI